MTNGTAPIGTIHRFFTKPPYNRDLNGGRPHRPQAANGSDEGS